MDKITIPNNGQSTEKVKRYTIMFENIPVLEFNIETDEVIVYDKEHLPFGLRGKEKISSAYVLDWLNNRINNLNRTYMNMVYIARKVGRDRDKVIKDSSGISFTDNFWIKTRDYIADWDELKRLRDDNIALNNVALTGELKESEDILKGFTSLFTTKGYFPKAVFGGYIYKLKKDAVLEYPAYLIGKQIGVNVAECNLDGEYVKIKIFTDYSTSLVHASELKTYFDTSDEIYNILVEDNKYQEIIKQLQKMYIFNYIIANPDLHDDNYGLLYDSKTFEFKSVSPCYDHNVAFQEGFLGLSRTTMGNSASIPLDDLCERFIGNHKDIAEKLKSIDLKDVKACLSERQFNELKERIANVISGIVDKISIMRAQELTDNVQITGEEARKLTSDIQELDSKIAMLKSKIKKETQFNKRMEMNIEIKNWNRRKKRLWGCEFHMWYAITGAIAVILIIILSILIYRFLKEKDKKEAENKKQSSRTLKFIFFFALLFVLDIPFVINESYKFGNWYHTLWGADDVLAFYGSFLSFLGTVVLGIIAIYQNKRANEVNESIMELTRRDKMAYLTPKPTIINSNRTIIFDFINKGNSFGIIKLITLQKDCDIIFQKAVEDFVDCEKEYKFDTGLELSDLKIKNEK